MEPREHIQKQRPSAKQRSDARQRRLRMRKRRQKQIRSLLLMALFLIIIIAALVFALKKENPKPADDSALPTESDLQAADSANPEEPIDPLDPDNPLLPDSGAKELHFALPEAAVLEGTSKARIEFSHGPTTGNVVHHGVKQLQEEILNRYDAYAVDLETPAEDKVLYLTFDCGYEYEGRTAACLDILKEKNVPAAFYLVGSFAEKQPELTQRMIDEGHIVGNHSMGHEDLTQIDDASVMKAVQDFDIYMKEHYDYNATTFRFPSGTFSERTLAMVHSFGYKTYFWSVAYKDWERDQGIGTEAAMEQLKDRLHPGAIILLHCVSADEPEVLEAFIDYARAEGYTFRLVEE